MKKYIAPTVVVVNIENEALLTESFGKNESTVSVALGRHGRGAYEDYDEEEEW